MTTQARKRTAQYLVSQGRSPERIARAMGVHPETVRRLVSR